MGRPTKFNTEIAERILSFIRLGHTPRAASEACGIAPRTLSHWLCLARRKPEDYPDLAYFLPRYLEANSSAIIELEQKAIADGKLSGELALKILERRRWKDWSQQAWRIKQQEREIEQLRKEVEELREMAVESRNEV